MKKINCLLALLSIGALTCTLYCVGNSTIYESGQPQNQVDSKQRDAFDQTLNTDDIPLNWKTFTNIRLGITFQYPGTWLNSDKESEVVNQSGSITALAVYFTDSLSKTTFSIEYYLPPMGADLYRYNVSQFESSQGLYATGREHIEIAGTKAIKAFATISNDGKGKALTFPLRLIVIDFLDKQQKGAIELQFKTPLNDDDIEVTKFNKLLSTFMFIE